MRYFLGAEMVQLPDRSSNTKKLGEGKRGQSGNISCSPCSLRGAFPPPPPVKKETSSMFRKKKTKSIKADSEHDSTTGKKTSTFNKQ